MKVLHKIISIILITPLSFILFVFGSVPLGEGYNVFQPYFDTKFAKEYSPELFKKINNNFSKSDVINYIGEPLYINQDTFHNQIQITFTYTEDGKLISKHEDFAWFRSYIIFDSKDSIISINYGWSYD